MKRYAEAVLNGHPDKFCDLVADRIVAAAYSADPEAYAQIEVSVWSDIIFLTGSIATRTPFLVDIEQLIRETGRQIGYNRDNYIDVSRYRILDHICRVDEDPRKWTHFVNDQSIVIGYAGYDALTSFLPPEHFLCCYFREAITRSMRYGLLRGQGPDGKILIIMHEQYDGWHINRILVTMQQQASCSFMSYTDLLSRTLSDAYDNLQQKDWRWKKDWRDIDVLINPNGPLVNGGSDGDNGQTGRKLVMDFYGPRVPIGGGAFYGKDLSHIDRLGAICARKFALHILSCGATEAIVRVCFAPGMDEALSVDLVADKRPPLDPSEFFSFQQMRQHITIADLDYDLTKLGTFYNRNLSINHLPFLRSHDYS